jgi:hypothetical protein
MELVEAQFVKKCFPPPLDPFPKKAKPFHSILAYWYFFNLWEPEFYI